MSHSENHPADILADCLEEIESGRETPEAVIARYPEHADALRDLLQLTSGLRRLPATEPSVPFKAAARVRLMEKLNERPPLIVQPRPWYRQLLQARGASWVTGLVTVLFAFLALGGIARAADRAIPGEALYPLDLALEQFETALPRRPVRAANLQLAHARERLEETAAVAAAAAAEGVDPTPEIVADLLDRYGLAISNAYAEAAQVADMAEQQELESLLNEEVAVLDRQLLASVAGGAAGEMIVGDGGGDGEASTPLIACSGATPHPAALRLAAAFEEASAEEAATLFCDGFGFGEIWLMYDLREEYGAQIDEIVALRKDGNGWGQIKGLLGLTGRMGTTTVPSITPSITIVPSQTPTRTIIVTSTPAATITVSPSVSPLPPTIAVPSSGTTGAETDCTGGETQPTGAGLAERYGVTYDEIMGWFCAGAGFGEIELAYELSLAADVPVKELFDRRGQGQSWGQIRQELLESPGSQGGSGQGSSGNNPGQGSGGNNPGQGNGGDNPGQGNGSGNPGQGNGGGNPGQGNGGDNPGQGNGGDNPGQGNSGGQNRKP